MLLTNEKNARFGKKILDLLEDAISVRIASGYIGLETFRQVEPRLRQIIDTGGNVIIIVGLGLFEGLSQKMVSALQSFDKYCREINPDSGVQACAYQRFHGKLYFIERSTGERVASVGSSNFSSTGFGDWWEGNLLVEEPERVDEIHHYIERLQQSNAIEIAAVDFPIKGSKSAQKNKEKPSQITIAKYSGTIPTVLKEPTFTIPIRLNGNAGLNLFMSKGRKEKKPHPYDSSLPRAQRRRITVYKPRPWYEVEMTIKTQDVSNELLNLLPNQTEPWKFRLVTANGDSYEAKFKRKTSGKLDQRTLREVGLDFMTSPRKDLGRILKGQLEDMGLLRYGEPVTEEILEEAEMTEMRFHELEEDTFLLEL